MPEEHYAHSRIIQDSGIVSDFLEGLDPCPGISDANTTLAGLLEQSHADFQRRYDHHATFGSMSNPDVFRYYHPTYAHADGRSVLHDHIPHPLSTQPSEPGLGMFHF